MNFRLDENGTKLVVDSEGVFANVQKNVAPYEFIGNVIEVLDENDNLASYVAVTEVAIDADDPTIFEFKYGTDGDMFVDNTTGIIYDSKNAILAARDPEIVDDGE